jgi:hypothetical protein
VVLVCNKAVAGTTMPFTGKSIFDNSLGLLSSDTTTLKRLIFFSTGPNPTFYCSAVLWEPILKADVSTLNCNARLVKNTVLNLE